MSISKYSKYVPIDVVDEQRVDTFVRAMSTKAQQIETIAQKEQQFLDETIANVDIIKQEDKDKFNAKISSLVEQINQASLTDLTNMKDIRNLTMGVKSIMSDPETQKGLKNTKKVRTIMDEIQKIMSNPQLMKNAYDGKLIQIAQEKVNKYLETPGADLEIDHVPLKDQELVNIDEKIQDISYSTYYEGLGDKDYDMFEVKFRQSAAIENTVKNVIQNSQHYQLIKEDFINKQPPEYFATIQQGLINYNAKLQEQLEEVDDNIKLSTNENQKQELIKAKNLLTQRLNQINTLANTDDLKTLASTWYDLEYIDGKVKQFQDVQRTPKPDVGEIKRREFGIQEYKLNEDNRRYEQDRADKIAIQEGDWRLEELKINAGKGGKTAQNAARVQNQLGLDNSYDLPIIEMDVPVEEGNVLTQNMESVNRLVEQQAQTMTSLIKELQTITRQEDLELINQELSKSGKTLDQYIIKGKRIPFTPNNLSLLNTALQKVQDQSGSITPSYSMQSIYQKINKVTSLSNLIKIQKGVHEHILQKTKEKTGKKYEQYSLEDLKDPSVWDFDMKEFISDYKSTATQMGYTYTGIKTKGFGLAFLNDRTAAKEKGYAEVLQLMDQIAANPKYLTDKTNSIIYPTTTIDLEEDEINKRKVNKDYVGKYSKENLQFISWSPENRTVQVQLLEKDEDKNMIATGKVFNIPLTNMQNNQLASATSLDITSIVDPRESLDEMIKSKHIPPSYLNELQKITLYVDPSKYQLPNGFMLQYNIKSIGDGYLKLNLQIGGKTREIEVPSLSSFEYNLAQTFRQAKAVYRNMSDNEILKQILNTL